MKPYRMTAVAVGVLYIMGTAFGVTSVILTSPIFDAPDVLLAASADGTRVLLGVMAVLGMGVSLAFVPLLMYPILRQHNEGMALGYVVFRTGLELVMYTFSVVSWLFVLALATTNGADAGLAGTISAAVLSTSEGISLLLALMFGTGALIFYTLLYQTRLIPRWLSIWGGIAIVTHLVAALLALFGVAPNFSTVNLILNMPIALQEMVMAVWMIAAGFNLSTVEGPRPVEKPAYAAGR